MRAQAGPDWRLFAFVALGANLGDPARQVLGAMDALQDLSRVPLLRSSLLRTPPVDCPPGSPDFVNAVAGLVPLDGESPETLLHKLQRLEKEYGRQPKTIMNEPRPLDLDLLVFREETRHTPDLILPHPRAHLRRFVLEPLAELAPSLILPGQTLTVSDVLSGLK